MAERRLLHCPIGQRVDELSQPRREPPSHGVRERDRPLEACGAHELDRLVHRSPGGDPLEERELIRRDPQSRTHRGSSAPASDRESRCRGRASGRAGSSRTRSAARARGRARPASPPPQRRRGRRRPPARTRERRLAGQLRAPAPRSSQAAEKRVVRHPATALGLHLDWLGASVREPRLPDDHRPALEHGTRADMR